MGYVLDAIWPNRIECRKLEDIEPEPDDKVPFEEPLETVSFRTSQLRFRDDPPWWIIRMRESRWWAKRMNKVIVLDEYSWHIHFIAPYQLNYSHERMLFEHNDYGEGWLGMADHVSNMTQSDRHVFETCEVIGTRVRRINGQKEGSKWDSPRWISERLGIGLQQARNLIDCWDVIELKKRDRGRSFSKLYKMKKDSQEKLFLGIGFVESLALELAIAEAVDPNDALENAPEQYDERRVSMTYRKAKAQKAVTAEEIFNPEEFENQMDQLASVTVDSDSNGVDVAPISDLDFKALGDDEVTPWLEKQPKAFQLLMKKLEALKDLGALKAMGRQVHAKFQFNYEQGDVFWKAYDRKKRDLTRAAGEKLSPAAAEIVAKMRSTTQPIPTVGRGLFRIQKKEITLKSGYPSAAEWEYIWSLYREIKSGTVQVANSKQSFEEMSEEALDSLLATCPAC